MDLGCGISKLVLHLAKKGKFGKVTGIDWSESAVEHMQELAAAEGLADCAFFSKMDARQLSFDDGSVDIFIDKGTLDAASTGDAPAAREIIREISRVLKKDTGRLLLVTHSGDERVEALKHAFKVVYRGTIVNGKRVYDVLLFKLHNTH